MPSWIILYITTDRLATMADASELPDALYYLRNFHEAIRWVVDRNHDLLSEAEQGFAAQFGQLSTSAQALLVRLLMRRGQLFRRSKISYPEIDQIEQALNELVQLGWLHPTPELSLHELFRLTTRRELSQRFSEIASVMTKQDAYDALAPIYCETRTFEAWLGVDEAVYLVTVASIALQFRLLHFGNFYQQWHEYTLAHLQIFSYEAVAFDQGSRPFESRSDIEFFFSLYRCYEAFSEGTSLTEALTRLPTAAPSHHWLRRRWDRLRYHLGLAAEREENAELALALYSQNAEPEACVRSVRVLERLGRSDEALCAAKARLSQTQNELVVQRVGRIVARLERLSGSAPTVRRAPCPWPSISLQLRPDPQERVELLVGRHLTSDETPVFYVENSLISSLFGLLCWDAIFLPLRGAFFHPFQSAPADLDCPDFVERRHAAFDACLARLDNADHVEYVLATFRAKHGKAAPFVHWQAIDEELLTIALRCIDPQHLKLYFQRLLADPSQNATGFPDLVQFFLRSRNYKLIEVKGPGDRLQDNQRRWLTYCSRHQLPVEVCQVSWA